MSIFLITSGVFFLVAGARDTQGELLTLLRNDFVGTGNFVYWYISLVIIGAIGYIKELRGLSHAILALVIIVMMVSNRGFFAAFQTQIADLKATSTTTIEDASSPGVVFSEPNPPAQSSGGGVGGIIGGVLQGALSLFGL